MLLGRIRQASATGAWLLRWAVLLIVKSSVSLLNSLLNGHVFMMTALYATLRYPLQSLSNGGEKLLIAGGNRWSWWLAKVAWTVAQALLYCVIAALIAAVFCLLSGGPLSLDTSPELMELFIDTRERACLVRACQAACIAHSPWCVSLPCVYSVNGVCCGASGCLIRRHARSAFRLLLFLPDCVLRMLCHGSQERLLHGQWNWWCCWMCFSCRDCRGVSRAGRRLL